MNLRLVLPLPFACALLVACPGPERDDGSTQQDPTGAATEGSASEGTATPAAAAEGSSADGTAPPSHEGSAHAPPPEGERTCDFVPTEVPAGGVTCPEGCVLIKGAPLHQTQRCAMTGFPFEVALACLRLPMEVVPEGACYTNDDGHVVLTAVSYPALSERGWRACPDDEPGREAPPCADRLVPPTDGAPADGAPADAPAAPPSDDEQP